MIDQHQLEILSQIELQELRTAFEAKWDQLHLVRTISAIVSFIILIIITTQITNKI